ncbi:ABC transporter [Frankia sp. CcI49]|uniref:branched-chain amino acid ABC transporter permease/ATP-binding protein n=1 Tax=unclassified Frankia TaxID=2632575 RepID=UPI0006CA0D97|nr:MULTISPECIES: branched-chain amino acid ABC transporter permease/ATP-binding protein [unclassified Frankia]KPM54243.1 ABC transporter [Frankia sp. R43]ONH61669.1 ABC transporter [Frankia sp. CcI49]
MEHIGSLLLGLGNGGVYAALGLALVLTYRSSGVINFATGAVALYVAYSYAFLRDGQLLVLLPGLPESVDIGGSWPLAPAAALSLLLGALLGAILYLAVFRPLREAPPLARAVASLGVLVVIQSTMAIRLGTSPVSVSAIFPAERWEFGDAKLLSDRFYLVVAVVVLTLVLTAVYRFTRFGLLTRAVAESQTGAYVSGVSPDRIALFNWMISGVTAGAAGILIAPLSPLSPTTYTLFVVPALAAAVVGGFKNLIPTVAAGIVIGMLQAEAQSLVSEDVSWLPKTGSSELIPLVVILVALLITGRGLTVRGGLLRQPLGRAPRPRSLTLPTLSGTALGVLGLLVTTGTWRAAVIGTFIAAIIGLSLVVVTGYAGQVSLAQLALAGSAAFTLSGLTQSWHVPFPFAPLLAALAATVLGVVIGLPALRLKGLTLGIVTLALAYTIEAVWFRNTDIVDSDGAQVTQPKLFGLDLSVGTGHAFPRLPFGLLCLAVLVAVAFGVAKLRTSALGSAMLAVRANEQSAAGIGINVVAVKVASFAIASFIAGLGGSLLAYRLNTVTFASFTALGGLSLLSTAYLAGVTSVYGGILAGVMASTGITFIAMDRWVHLGDWFPVITGVLLLVALIGHPEGFASGGHDLADRLDRLRHRRAGKSPAKQVAAPAAGALSTPAETAEPSAETVVLAGLAKPDAAAEADPAKPTTQVAPAGTVLEIDGLTVRYGGVTAVSEVSMRVDAGQIVGLIGPNGAGKTSVIDATTGFTRADGTVRLAGTHIEGLPTHSRVRRGLARTFQSLELYDDLTVEENVSAALFGASGDERHRALASALDLVGLADRAGRHAGELSQGERQLVSIARACATGPKALLLDEPAAGLDTTESVWLGERIRSISATGVGVILVDHDVSLVLSVCDYIYVLDFGKVIAEGDPAAIRANRAVADAYLGSVHDALADEAAATDTAPTDPAPAADPAAAAEPATPVEAAAPADPAASEDPAAPAIAEPLTASAAAAAATTTPATVTTSSAVTK